jgi:DNA repair exonuclease SbcCD ATPase subunit
MNIKELLARMIKNETLTDEEKAFVAAYDPDKVINSTAAAARKSAEAKLKEKESAMQQLQADIEALRAEADEKANANKPEIERLSKELEKFKKTVAEKDAAFQKLESEKRQMIRSGKIGKILSGFKFVDGLDSDIPRLGIEKALAEIKDEDLDAEDLIKPIMEKFRASNKAILADTSGHGAGNPPKDGTGGAFNSQSKPVDQMSANERAADLKKRGII